MKYYKNTIEITINYIKEIKKNNTHHVSYGTTPQNNERIKKNDLSFFYNPPERDNFYIHTFII